MNKPERLQISQLLAELYPNWKATPETITIYVDEVDKPHMDYAAARAVVIEAKRQHNFQGEPPLHLINELVRKEARKFYAAKHAQTNAAKNQRNESTTHNYKTIGEWKRYYSTDIQGKLEWDVLPANVRRGLRSIFGGTFGKVET